jgi:hypothetical protein
MLALTAVKRYTGLGVAFSNTKRSRRRLPAEVHSFVEAGEFEVATNRVEFDGGFESVGDVEQPFVIGLSGVEFCRNSL